MWRNKLTRFQGRHLDKLRHSRRLETGERHRVTKTVDVPSRDCWWHTVISGCPWCDVWRLHRQTYLLLLLLSLSLFKSFSNGFSLNSSDQSTLFLLLLLLIGTIKNVNGGRKAVERSSCNNFLLSVCLFVLQKLQHHFFCFLSKMNKRLERERERESERERCVYVCA